MAPADISKLAFDILESLKKGKLVGYALFLVSIISWYAHARWQRHKYAKEMDRIAGEKSKLQKRALGNKIESSRSRPPKKK